MGGGRRQAAPESIGVCSAADDGDVKQVLLEVYRVSTPTAASPARMGVSSRTRLLWSAPEHSRGLELYSLGMRAKRAGKKKSSRDEHGVLE